MCAKHTPFYNAGAYDSPRAKLVIGDAKAGLEAEPDGSIDVIICDLSDPLDGGPCYQLYTTSFYEMQVQARAVGILVTQFGAPLFATARRFSPSSTRPPRCSPRCGATPCACPPSAPSGVSTSP